MAGWTRTDPNRPRPAVQAIIADSRSDVDNYPVNTGGNSMRTDFPKLLEPLKA